MAAAVAASGGSLQGPLTEPQGAPGVDTAGVPSGQKRAREDEVVATGDKKWPGWPGDNVFRLVVPVSKVGSIIGRKGEFIKKMCEETRSRIKILEGIPGTPDRVVMVSAREEPEGLLSPAMDGLLKVHKRVIDGLESEIDGSAMRTGLVSTKLLVPVTQAGSLIGRQGTTIKSIQDDSGAIVRVISSEEPPICGLQDDRVVEIQGEGPKVQKAMELVVSHLRKFLVDRSILPLFERAVQSQGQQSLPQGAWGHSSAASLHGSSGGGLGGTSHYGLPGSGVSGLGGTSHYGAPSSAGPGLSGASHYSTPSFQHESYYPPADNFDSQSHHHGVSIYGRDPSLGGINTQLSAPPAPVITQVTQKMQIPLSYADAIIGTAGANISYMRRSSGATITIQETRGVHGEMTVEIHGTAPQVQAAQQLVQNFMAGSSAPVSSYSGADTSYSSYNTQSYYPSASASASGLAMNSYSSSYNGSHGY
ncbi:hypothetical protein GOP47_0023404 [Adiantum capillus-veneris]|uniref:K Homology domain-containing protein n=1 Tax=Adiantum capillus-veneris TaxID=13818 RepID=A0A9D4U5L6_ADICA|nr:hypothetical protein GOP47_0023404 [Adiantum capillus-veneris]